MIDDLNRQDEADVRALLATAEGARFFCRAIEECRVYRSSYEHADPGGTAFREGMRAMGLWLMTLVRAGGGERAVMAAREERLRLLEREEAEEWAE